MNLLSLALALHALAAVAWVGGMIFAYWFVRPVAGRALDLPNRLALWHGVFSRFLPMVWVAIAMLLITGYYMVLGPLGGFPAMGLHVHLMHGLALLMTAVFAYVYFMPWRRFRRAFSRMEEDAAAAALDGVRRGVAVNLALGLIVVTVAAGGRYWAG